MAREAQQSDLSPTLQPQGQTMPHVPARGHSDGTQPGAPDEEDEETDTAATDNSFSTEVDWHLGQGTLSTLKLTSSSNFSPQSSHLYS